MFASTPGPATTTTAAPPSSLQKLQMVGNTLEGDTFSESLSNKTGMTISAVKAVIPVAPVYTGPTYQCNAGTGVCDCVPGYYGDGCNSKCQCDSKGTERCNDGLRGDGSCACKAHYTGATCSQCDSYFYGASCEYFCHPSLTRNELRALSMVNIKRGYGCGGHGACYFQRETASGLILPAGCTCSPTYQGFFEFNWAYSTDCSSIDGTSLSTAALALKPTSGCVKKGVSVYNNSYYQSR